MNRFQQLSRSKFVQDTIVVQFGKIGIILLGALSTILVTRLMGPQLYGVYGLSDSFYNLWKALDLTGVSTSTSTRLGIAIGAGDQPEIRRLMAFYVQISVITTIGLALLLALFGASVAAWLQGNALIGTLAALLALTGPGDAFYNLVVLTLQSRRSFRTLTALQNVNQLVFTTSMIVAVLVNPTPFSLVVARLFYAYSTMIIALVAYERLRQREGFSFPSMRAVLALAPRQSPRPYWRFGVANALDKNVSNLYLEIPMQLVGVFGGERAVGYLKLALRALTQASVLTSAIFENMQAIVPQMVGRGDYRGLWRNFTRVLGVLALGGITFYGLVALVAPFIIPLLFGDDWLPAIPVLVPLAVYGATTMMGGIFGPLYRAFGIMRSAFTVKLVALVLALPLGILLMTRSAALPDPFLGWTRFDAAAAGVAVGGAWTINLLFLISVSLTMVITLPLLRRKAQKVV